MNQYTYFAKDQFEIRDDKEQPIVAPAFISKSPKNYRYNHSNSILEKKCIECQNYYPVQKYDGKKFYDIHDEKIIHMFSVESGYEYRCSRCLDEKKNKENSTKEKPIEVSNTGSFHLTKDNLRYIKHLAVEEDSTDEECLNDIVKLIRSKNKLTVHYEQKIK